MNKGHDPLPDEVKGLFCGMFIVFLIIMSLVMPVHIDHWNRKDEEIVSKVTSVYSREHKHGKTSNYTKYTVCATEKDGQIDLEVPNGTKVGDEIKYLKNYGPFGIVPTIYKRK